MSIDIKRAAKSLEKLSVLKFFPSDDTARTEIVAMSCMMASNNLQIDWLANRCVEIWNEWEGPREMRAVFCSKFRPADGVEAFSRLPQFADGIPSSDEGRNRELLGAKEPKRLDPGAASQLCR